MTFNESLVIMMEHECIETQTHLCTSVQNHHAQTHLLSHQCAKSGLASTQHRQGMSPKTSKQHRKTAKTAFYPPMMVRLLFPTQPPETTATSKTPVRSGTEAVNGIEKHSAIIVSTCASSKDGQCPRDTHRLHGGVAATKKGEDNEEKRTIWTNNNTVTLQKHVRRCVSRCNDAHHDGCHSRKNSRVPKKKGIRSSITTIN